MHDRTLQHSQVDVRISAAENQRQVLRFLVVGGASVAVDLVCYFALTTTLAFPPSVAKCLSYVAGMAVGFVGNKFWTFGSARRSASEPLSYTVLYAVTLAVNIGVNAIVLSITGGWKLPAFLVATGVTTVLNFVGMRLFTFRHGMRERLRAEGASAAAPAVTIEPHAPHAPLAASPSNLVQG